MKEVGKEVGNESALGEYDLMAPGGGGWLKMYPFTYMTSCIRLEKVEKMGSQGYHEWTPSLASISGWCHSLYMQTQKSIIKLSFGLGLSAREAGKSWGRRVREEGALIRVLGSSLTGLELGIIRL